MRKGSCSRDVDEEVKKGKAREEKAKDGSKEMSVYKEVEWIDKAGRASLGGLDVEEEG